MVLIALGQLELSFQLVAPPLGKPGPLGLDQEVEGLRDRIVQEGLDRRQATCMRHGSLGAGAALVGLHHRGREQGPVELPDLEGSIWVCDSPLLPKIWKGSVLVRYQSLYSSLRSGKSSVSSLSRLLSTESADVLHRSCPRVIQPSLVCRMVGASRQVSAALKCCFRQDRDLHSLRGGRG